MYRRGTLRLYFTNRNSSCDKQKLFLFLHLKTTIDMLKDRVPYWIDLADYDIETAETLYNGGRWLYVAFMCHQAIEKTLKAYWCDTLHTDPPFIHNLIRLAEDTGLEKEMTDAQLDTIETLVPMNIQARYPEYKEQLAQMLSKERCRTIIDETKQLQQWIKNKLSDSSKDTSKS